jgi:hypothetical protein
LTRTDIAEVLRTRACGVYQCRDPLPSDWPAGPGPRLVRIAGITGREALMRGFAQAFGFPPWFGGNWDALEESLTDLRPDPAGVVLSLSGVDALAAEDPAAPGLLVDLLSDVAAAWGVRGDLLVVLVDNAAHNAPLLPQIAAG